MLSTVYSQNSVSSVGTRVYLLSDQASWAADGLYQSKFSRLVLAVDCLTGFKQQWIGPSCPAGPWEKYSSRAQTHKWKSSSSGLTGIEALLYLGQLGFYVLAVAAIFLVEDWRSRDACIGIGCAQ